MTRNLLALIGLFTVLFGGAFIAYAQHDDAAWAEPRAMAVSFAGLDLASPEGQQMLDRRLHAALNQVCGRDDMRDLALASSVRRCRRDAMAGTRPQVRIAIQDAMRRRAYADARDAQVRTAALPAN